jgi:CHAD domain-containing protein
MKVDETVIDRSAEEGARYVALALLADGDGAAARLAAGGDDEALHDFRVALRRLRSTLRAFRPWLKGSVERKMEKRLRRLAHATNDARDAQVQLQWIGEQRHALGRRQRVAVEYLSERLETRRSAWAREQARVLARYGRASHKLFERLQTYRGRIDASARSNTYGSALAGGMAEIWRAPKLSQRRQCAPSPDMRSRRSRAARRRPRTALAHPRTFPEPPPTDR